jgi:uncharacterized protein YdeI (YjbR/CyaY-like superfamily)
MDNALYFANKEEWSNWLAKNHNKNDDAWLLYYKKGSDKGGISYEESVDEAICFGWIDSKLKKIDDDRFALRFSPRKPKSVWSKINREKAEKLMLTGRMTEAGLVAIEKAKASGSWENAYTNKVKDALPPDLEEALRKNVHAWSNFQGFANSYRNMYIGWVNNAKTDETRRKRIQKVVESASKNTKLISS